MSRQAGRALRMAYLVASVAGVGFFILSVVLLGYWPKKVLDAQTRAMGPEAPAESPTPLREFTSLHRTGTRGSRRASNTPS